MLNLFIKKCAVGLGVLLTVFSVSTCFCDSQMQKEPSENQHHLGVGPDFLFYKWDKKIGDVKSKGSQLFGGARLRYEYLSPDLFYLGLDLAGFETIKNYKIRNNDQPLDHDHDANRRLGHADLRLGYTFSDENSDYLITPFFGVGSYYFLRDRRHREQKVFIKDLFSYVSGGMNLKCCLADRLELGCRLKVFYVFSEKIRLKFKDKQIKQEKKLWGGELSIPIVWHMSKTKSWDVGFEPYALALGFSKEKEQIAFGAKLLFEANF